MIKTRKKFFAAIIIAALSFSLLTACASEKNPGSSGDSDGNNPAATGTAVKSVGEFTTQNLNGDSVTQDIFSENDLTMVNVFATWCTPCVQEMPYLEQLHQQMKDKNVGIVGVVLDVLDEKGNIVDESLERAQQLVEKTGVTYPVLLPDTTYLNGRLIGIDSLPETFFVDKDGNIVGDHYTGSGDLEDWTEVVETELANLKEGA